MKSELGLSLVVCLSVISFGTLTVCQQGTVYSGPNGGHGQGRVDPSRTRRPLTSVQAAEEVQPTSQQTIPMRKQIEELRKLQGQLKIWRGQVREKKREVAATISEIAWQADHLEHLQAAMGPELDRKNWEIRTLKDQLQSRNCIVADRGQGYVRAVDAGHGYARVADDLHMDCKHPADTGDCRGSFIHYFYDEGTGACQEFMWGGCNGNPNNFQTQAECELKCVRGTPFNETSVDKGPPF